MSSSKRILVEKSTGNFEWIITLMHKWTVQKSLKQGCYWINSEIYVWRVGKKERLNWSLIVSKFLLFNTIGKICVNGGNKVDASFWFFKEKYWGLLLEIYKENIFWSHRVQFLLNLTLFFAIVNNKNCFFNSTKISIIWQIEVS